MEEGSRGEESCQEEGKDETWAEVARTAGESGLSFLRPFLRQLDSFVVHFKKGNHLRPADAPSITDPLASPHQRQQLGTAPHAPHLSRLGSRLSGFPLGRRLVSPRSGHPRRDPSHRPPGFLGLAALYLLHHALARL